LKVPGLVGRQHRGLAALGAARDGRVDAEDVAGDKPVESHGDRGEELLDGWLGSGGLQRLVAGAPCSGEILTSC
jgi:hypothetical protein